MTASVVEAYRRLGAAHRTDVERAPLARARGRVLAERAAGLAVGRRLTAADLGALAAAGLAEAPCARRPTVAVFTSGDGLRPPGQTLGAGERHDACRAVVIALLQEAGLDPVAWPILPATPELAVAALRDAAQAFDLIIACSDLDASSQLRLSTLINGETAAPFGTRAPSSVLALLPNDREAVAATWSNTVAVLIDAMQGAVATPAGTLFAAKAGSTESPMTLEVRDVAGRLAGGARLYDVREVDEHALGMPAGAAPLPLSGLDAGFDVPRDDGVPLLLICARGQRSERAAALLRSRGFRDVSSVRGGVDAWRAAGLPMDGPVTTLPFDADALARYDRHLRLADVGREGQQRLGSARVVIVGAGGLGSPAAFYLAAAGVGSLVLIDDDNVERSNLQRQILHVDAAVGSPKVRSARDRLLALNPRIAVEATEARVGPRNVETLLRSADVVIDGSDNFAARYLIDAACRQLGIPLVYGAVERFTGHVSVFDAGRRRGEAPCYRCLFPDPPGADAAPNCAEAGVLGVLPGLIGVLQATEALKLILGIGEPLVGRVLTVDARSMQFRELVLEADPDCPGCGASARFEGYDAIETFCASR
jgi:molybdopterin/thiamine biosynthesis adenylyltransferase/rhodanese-related sulfurtransferase